MSPPDYSTAKHSVPIRFELLTARHNEKVAPFDCGNPTIMQWFRQDALQEMVAGKYVTYVAVEEETENENVVGFVAVRADFIAYPPRKAGATYIPVVPVIQIAYLGRDRNWKYREVGLRLVLEALQIALDVQDKIWGFAGVHLTSTDKARHLYTGAPFRFVPHPAANTSADYYKSMQAIRLMLQGGEEPLG